MRNLTLLILCICCYQILYAQVENRKKLIVANKVKSEFKKLCFPGSNGSCTSYYQMFDQRGNSIEWDMGRLGTRYRMIYNKNDSLIFQYSINKLDPTKIDTISFKYDKFGERILDGKKQFENFYNSNNQLVKQIETKSDNTDSIKVIRTMDYNSFDKVKLQLTCVLKQTADNKYAHHNTYCKQFQYDSCSNLVIEIHYTNDTLTNTINYRYDALNRLIEKREENLWRLESVNNHIYGNREAIDEFITKISYNPDGTVDEKYAYFLDPCMSLDDHFLYKHYYYESGLLDRVEAYACEELTFTISYEYEYYK